MKTYKKPVISVSTLHTEERIASVCTEKFVEWDTPGDSIDGCTGKIIYLDDLSGS